MPYGGKRKDSQMCMANNTYRYFIKIHEPYSQIPWNTFKVHNINNGAASVKQMITYYVSKISVEV